MVAILSYSPWLLTVRVVNCVEEVEGHTAQGRANAPGRSGTQPWPGRKEKKAVGGGREEASMVSLAARNAALAAQMRQQGTSWDCQRREMDSLGGEVLGA